MYTEGGVPNTITTAMEHHPRKGILLRVSVRRNQSPFSVRPQDHNFLKSEHIPSRELLQAPHTAEKYIDGGQLSGWQDGSPQ